MDLHENQQEKYENNNEIHYDKENITKNSDPNNDASNEKESENIIVPSKEFFESEKEIFSNYYLIQGKEKPETKEIEENDEIKEQKKHIVSYEPIPNTYLTKKKEKMYQECLTSFGSENLVLHKSYSRLEKEKIELIRKRKNWEFNQENNKEVKYDSNDNEHIIEDKKTEENVNKIKEFMSDVKLNKPKFVLERERLGDQTPYKSCSMKKTEIENKNNEFGGDWNEVMNTSRKKVSLVQREKILYREQILRRKEIDLKNREKDNKGVVLKFDTLMEEKEHIHKMKENRSMNMTSDKKLISQKLDEMNDKKCTNCNFEITDNDHMKIYNCGHCIHNKCWLSLKFFQRSECQLCKNKIKQKSLVEKSSHETLNINQTCIGINKIIPQNTENFNIEASEINNEQ